jgi:hypothetical protein
MKDTYDRDIQVGDKIAYAPYNAGVSYGSTTIFRGTVIGFTPTKVRVELENPALKVSHWSPATFMDTVLPGRTMVLS